ncbi:hypothetical protein BDV26DRAFT_296668 [Aspergillus bertholletiae]|uniref:Thiamine-binding protein domain-containing protein n=1 Tax=Aspergillus bertholletiae TaxID=1226010 RepID=A0A5N7AY52_9EURO|nr:hypothetical protein BDV26DRAFT_296668 [Aspergillus bertholletiae]
METADLTPLTCIADFSLISIGLQNASFSKHIAEIQDLLQKSGLKYQMATGTSVDGPWGQVARVIGYAHTLIHKEGIPRIQTDIRITTRADKDQPMEGSMLSVEKIIVT